MRTPPLAAVLVFIAALTAITMLRGAFASDKKPPPEPPAQLRHHPTSPFERVPTW